MFLKKEFDPNKRYSASDVMKSEWLTKFTEPETIDRPLMIDTLENLRKFRVFFLQFIFFNLYKGW